MAVQGIAVALNVVLRSRAAQAALGGLATALSGAKKVGQGLNFATGLLSKSLGILKKAAFGAGVALAGMFASAWQSPALAAGIDKIKVALLEFGEIVAPILNKVIDFFLYAINAAKRFFQINRARIIELLNKLEPIIQGIVDAFFDLGEIALETAHNIVDFIKSSDGFSKVRAFIDAIKTSLDTQKESWINLFTKAGELIGGIINDITGLVNKVLGISDDLSDADFDQKFKDAKDSVDGVTDAVNRLAAAIEWVQGIINGIKSAPGRLAEGINNKLEEFATEGVKMGVNFPGPVDLANAQLNPLGTIASGTANLIASGANDTNTDRANREAERQREKDRKKKEKERKKAEREAEQKRKQERNKNIFNTAIDYGKKAIDWGKKTLSGAGNFIKGLFGKADGGEISSTGPYLLHAGERVVPRQQVASGGMGNVSINITTGPVNSQVDLRNLATLISREIAKQNKYGRGSVSVN